jgi:UDP-N-acetylmuramoylalanine--D-glutamate ligase
VREDTAVVLELSSFQLGGVREKGYSPKVAVFTNLLDDHLNYYGSRDAYFEDKRVIYRYQARGDLLVLNRDNRVFSLARPNPGVQLVSFGLDGDFRGDGSYVEGRSVSYRSGGRSVRILDRAKIAIPGLHNLYNVLAAVAAALAMGVDVELVRKGISGFTGLPHRLEQLGSDKGIRFVNDSAATTPDATVQGISSIQGPLTLIAGGADKGLDLDRFVEILNTRVSHLLLLQGSGTERLLNQGLTTGYSLFDNLEDAFTQAIQVSTPGTTVLLSPGFASFGMFKNEFDRGDRFRELVRRHRGDEVV